ncbi:MAG TPA: PorV/PorQ family protein [bacterium]|nr:PorV/PorQ family protein [bacterium]HPN44216.1 PorV/PorQ family protein [bacterium]
MKSRLIITLLVMALAAPLFAAGENGMAVLKIGVSARAAAMGEAFTATADDASGVFWNPAGITWSQHRQAHFTHNEWIQGITHDAASLIIPHNNWAIGLDLMLNNVSDFERRIIASEEPFGTFSSHDFSMALTFSHMIGKDISVGGRVRYLSEKIYDESASGVAVDLGARYRVLPGRLFVAAAMQNLGKMSEMVQEEVKLPATLRLGAGYYLPGQIFGNNLLLAADYVKIFNEDDHINLGLEYTPVPVVALRGGYQTGYEERSLTAGFGVNIGFLSIDYAFIPFTNDLGTGHKFSLLADF